MKIPPMLQLDNQDLKKSKKITWKDTTYYYVYTCY